MLSFTLPDEFIDQYATKPVSWGYTDAGGSSLGEITFLRTYSRLKEDGTKERWHEVCRRVIEGMFSIQKDHCKSNRLPWNDHKAQRSARDAYDRMFAFKWTPPGRGLWIMGTPLVNDQRNSAALQNCFTSETRFVTRDGIRTLGEMDGSEVEVYANGDWHKGSVRDFGVQSVQRITFAPHSRRSNHRIVETATPDHRWELADGTLTTDLQVGDVVRGSVVHDDFILGGYYHGLIFADGSIHYTYANGDYGHAMRLCGDKAKHASLFEDVHYQPNCAGDPVVYHRSSTNMKALPVSDDPRYLNAFIQGWMDMDGRDRTGGNRAISTQDPDAVQWLIDNAAFAGFQVVGVNYEIAPTNYGPRKAPLASITLSKQAINWTVKAIEPLDDPVPVFCAVVPEVERFTLASGLLTSNCGFVSTGDMTKIDPAGPFCWLMEASMLGVGIGFDDKGADKNFTIYAPIRGAQAWTIPDTREGWVESVRMLIESYLMSGKSEAVFDYTTIRPAGEPIMTFGGVAAGPEPLMKLHRKIRELFDGRDGHLLTRIDIADIGNLIGVCVVSGNVRRSAELLIGRIDDKDFVNLKNPLAFAARNHVQGFVDGTGELLDGDTQDPGWGWMSNNSVEAKVGDSYDHIVDSIALNGEPGIIWMDTTRKFGRLLDQENNKDWRASGYNPCLSGDSIIETVDGPRRLVDITEPTLVYSRSSDGRLTTAKASAAFKTKENATTLRIELQNGDDLICTPDHRIMRRDGSWVEAQHLRPNDSLEVLCRARRGWRYAGVRLASQKPAEQIMEHRMIWEGVYGTIPDGSDVDHINRDHQDNRIDNLRVLSHDEHARLSRAQVPNNHQVQGLGGYVRSGLHGAKPASGAFNPVRRTGWTNQHTVKAITEGPVIDVYDITVDETHNFIANNVVVHNCAEQSLESYEMCTLVETYLNRHDSLEDLQQTLKYAFMYAKTVTLLPTHWQRTNAIMQRNRRIGCSISGIANFADTRGMTTLRTWLNDGYATVQNYDRIYSEWLCVRESIKTTTVKPSGTVSILAGESPGVHWAPGGEHFDRAVRFRSNDSMVDLFRAAGYRIEVDVRNPEDTVVVFFPIHSNARRAEGDVSIFEKANLAVVAQRYWSDNSVSVTLSFDPASEAEHVGTVLHMHEGQLKTVSFLPIFTGVYPQMPYTQITREQYDEATLSLFKVDLSPIYDGVGARDAEGEKFCTTDVCMIKDEQLFAAQ